LNNPLEEDLAVLKEDLVDNGNHHPHKMVSNHAEG